MNNIKFNLKWTGIKYKIQILINNTNKLYIIYVKEILILEVEDIMTIREIISNKKDKEINI